MRIEKQNLSALDQCYSVSVMEHNGAPSVFFASEARDGACLAWDIPGLKNRQTIWTEPGGCMSMVPIPGRQNEFFAIQRFYRLWNWEGAQLVWVKLTDDGETFMKPMVNLAYLHRFDFLCSEGEVYLIACTVADRKSSLEDWSCPGRVYVAKLPQNLEDGLELTTLRDGLYQNHGYARIRWQGREAGLVTCRNGAFVVTPPTGRSQIGQSRDWQVEQLLDIPISDADMIDIDGDGQPEMATIEAFHGDRFRIYKKIDGAWRMVFQHPEIADFYHVVKAGVIAGCPVFVGGGRGGKQQLFLVRQDGPGADFEVVTMDEGSGPSNVAIAGIDGMDMVFAANRQSNYATVYKIKK